MSFQFEPLVPACVAFDRVGTPMSPLYGDIYHARQGALAQAEHVFLGGNGLPQRWRGRAGFTVCETGFGLGQNFLALWQAWRGDPQRSRRLHMVAFEAHPFSRADLASVLLARLPEGLLGLARQLVDQWPPLLPGMHRLEFEGGAVTLTLAFGTVNRLARLVQARADAFFLDGFSPLKNPEMWTPALFGQLVRMAAQGATAATWCTAAEVRRTMSDAGFLVSKAQGLGQTRDMTVATLRPNLGREEPPAASREPVLIIGGGLAAAGIAHSLGLRGQASTVIDPVFAQGLGASHRGHIAAALTPLISRDDDFRARLTRSGGRRALQRWQGLAEIARPRPCGTVELVQDAEEERERRQTLAALSFPADWVQWQDADQASARLGFNVVQGGVYFADGQLIRPEPLIEALLGEGPVRCLGSRVVRLERSRAGEGWQAFGPDGAVLASSHTVVLAGAMQVPALLPEFLPSHELSKLRAMHALAGQVSYFSPEAVYDPQVVLGGIGYWLPGVDGVCVGGSTYVPNAIQAQVSAQGHADIARKLTGLVGLPQQQLLDWAKKGLGWAGWRAVVSGRLPVIGPVRQAPGLWLACAYGSRGLTWSALAGDIIAASLHQEPMPLERDLLRAIAPR
ncbi:FAD-dependent 5-carboxymethylaminomethyl-2-thiouridine(34) oxidoreductase MnmC [Eoetvoesiella caeni]|uniref:tRNA 5-methylaminomethyl-2-thiouridine biosynthesis bifunctional protein MnmC n=1 Tax=Eoetvoesiella caeni TaxID=645616 RepID=A0A366H9C4_9BURK|nr:FAD-dependent 5-carboxymethylaminomethyl-2-thiouridine(34) oxidoreductase MnmC [Eoetvoesiella caeni]MCI2809485.1 FAD-dependent 5-carboxymethylaminomethyl-2-thiouridine(34) oxidoreductase MnmC [Eoetvoesiella caeni]NYT55981.1 FAD-dependent 5-carboxymethylaminomethyl-2-thiouridine(34) oxidoreductase MnmC [Eoetvoesiella caeni]RBP38744.1 tRNA 5-methylaminomethyl-2-thiouridine biosynthesis bifunctional protein [Eoetvoesiella caeni]